MPPTEAIREFSPVELPSHKPIPLKRSRSSSSIASLPTPPRTRHRKRKRSHSRHSRATDSDSEFEGNVSDNDEHPPVRANLSPMGGALFVGHKKRKMLRVDAIAAELSGQAAEDAFWMGESTTTAAPGTSHAGAKAKAKVVTVEATTSGARPRSPTRSPSSSPPAHLLKRTRTGLLSPPKSRRHRSPPRRLLVVPETIEESPSTPALKVGGEPGVRRKLFPERDSPNNPFLVTESQASQTSGSQSSIGTSSRPRTPARHVEKPTIAYVL